MKHFTGLDLSLKKTFVTIIDNNGEIVKQGLIVTDIDVIDKFLEADKFPNQKIGIEAGQLSISISKGLIKKGHDVVCVDARQMSSLLSARKVNKNDCNDSVGIAQMIRGNLHKEIAVKSDQSCKLKILLGSRKQIVNSRMRISGTIRGLLKIYGIKISARNSNHAMFTSSVIEQIAKLDEISKSSIEALLSSLSAIERSLSDLDKNLNKLAKNDKECKLLMTIPGVGVITAIIYKITLDDPKRFKNSATVGSYIGLTPKQYSSGEINRQGSISKMGPKDCRYSLYEAAQSLLLISKKQSKLKKWGLRLAKKKGRKKAIVAVARKLAVIMHRMLIDEKEFCYN